MEIIEDEKESKLPLLEKIFENVNNWLAFAEGKNAALIAFNIAFIAALLSSEEIFSHLILVCGIILGVCVSSIISLKSFVPCTENEHRGDGIKKSKDNLLLYTHIAKYNKEEYLIAIYKKYGNIRIQKEELPKIELDYADEITYNASITVRKYECFRKAVTIDVIILIIFGIYVFCNTIYISITSCSV